MAQGLLDPGDAYAAHLWSDELIAGADAALALSGLPDGDVTSGRDW